MHPPAGMPCVISGTIWTRTTTRWEEALLAFYPRSDGTGRPQSAVTA